MSKIYYTYRTYTTHYSAPRYIDAQGQMQHIEGDVAEWEEQHKGAVYLKPDDFDKRVRQAAADRVKLLAWKEWAV